MELIGIGVLLIWLARAFGSIEEARGKNGGSISLRDRYEEVDPLVDLARKHGIDIGE